MSEIYLTKTASGSLAPASEEDAALLKRFKTGAVVRCEVSGMRNYEFHRKWFALVKFAYDHWSDTANLTYKGQPVLPSFDRFRRDITILAGHGYPVANLRGEVRFEADSISFANMTPETFEALYSATIDVVLNRILTGKGYSEETLRALVDQTLAFA